MPTRACTATSRPSATRHRAPRSPSILAALEFHALARQATARLPLRQLLVALEHGQRVAPHLAQQLVVVAHAVDAHAFAHRAAGFLLVAAIAEAALQRQRRDVLEAEREPR